MICVCVNELCVSGREFSLMGREIVGDDPLSQTQVLCDKFRLTANVGV